jgi:DNA-binding CsgD family transcriptional regulator
MSAGAATPIALVGREAETARLHALARQAATGRGTAVILDGEPGIGKTALLDLVAEECVRLRMRVVRGAAEDLEQRLPFAAVGNCLGLWAADPPAPGVARVAGLLRGEDVLGRSAAAANHEFAVTEAILELVDRWCATGPVALILDDVQWSDPSSNVVLHRLGQGIDQQRLLLLLALRSTARSEPAASLLRSLSSRGAQHLMLEPVPKPAVASLVERSLAAEPGPHLLGLLGAAGGNPMYVTELVAAMSREAAIQISDGTAEVTDQVWESPAGWLPKSLVDVILQRLESLPRTARETLEMAAVLGTTVDVAELSTVLDMSVMALTDVVVAAIDAGLLTDTGQQLTFRHDLIREALAGHLPGPVRTALHLRAGEVLAAEGAAAERVAGHLMAGTSLDRRTLDWLDGTADQLIVRAPEQAVGLLRRALSTVDDERAHKLRFHLARALLWAGDPAGAEQVARAALTAGPDPDRVSTLYWLLLQSRYRQGHLTDAVDAVDEALASPHLTPAEAGRFRGFSALCLFYLARLDDGERAAEAAIAAGSRTGDVRATGLGYLALSGMRFMQSDMAQALALNDRALTAFEHGIQPDLQVDPHTMQGYCLFELDRFPEADQALATAVRHNQQTGGVYLTLAHSIRAQLRLLDGRWDDALAEIETGLDSPDPLGQAEGLRGWRSLIAVHRGGPTPDLEAGPDPAESETATKYGWITSWAWALARAAREGPQPALDLLYPRWENQGPLEPRRIIHPICADLARLAADVGDRDRARHLAATTAELAARQATASLTGTARLCRGLADGDPDVLLAAATSFRRAGWLLHEAYAQEDAAAVLARARRDADARTALGAALRIYRDLDASWDIGRADARLRRVGIRRGVRGPRKRPKYGWEALTATETKVAMLVAEGRSNPDIAISMFLSRRTVQSHVSSILAKLGLHSRVALAISVSRRATPSI